MKMSEKLSLVEQHTRLGESRGKDKKIPQKRIKAKYRTFCTPSNFGVEMFWFKPHTIL